MQYQTDAHAVRWSKHPCADMEIAAFFGGGGDFFR